jgi:single-stranded-DNA-specific exonuclease
MNANYRIQRRPIPERQHALPPELHPVLKRIYLARAVTQSEQLERSLKYLIPFEQLKGLDEAVALLVAALESGERILVVGDFDADGATSCAVAVRGLKALGAPQVDYLVPNRFEYGYGLTPEIVEVAQRYAPDLIITVDNGISSVQGVSAAKAAGQKVLVTDHHLAGTTLPPADAIVNPNQPGDEFSSKHLAGVGVIFYVLMALRARLRQRGWFDAERREPPLADILDLVALGTVADVVTLDHNNRILVAQGLARIRAGEACEGIKALLRVAGRDPRRTTASDLGFCVGPRLNAAGRLDDMSIGIRCLLSDDPQQAYELAQQLDGLNRERRKIEQQMREQAMADVDELTLEDEQLPAGLCLFNPQWHEGVIGIVAGRIKERFHRPVIAFAPAQQGLLKGSARSIAGVHIRDVLASVAARYPQLIAKFGGHAMAAGLTLAADDLEAFRAAFNAALDEQLDPGVLEGVIHSDGELRGEEMNLELAEILRHAGPWGQGFPEPVFDGEFELLQRRIVGERHLKLVVRPLDGSTSLDAIAFHTTDVDWPARVERVKLAFNLDVNEYLGQRSAQLLVQHIQPLA